MFRARLASIFTTSHKMPRLPRNLHLVGTALDAAQTMRFAKNTQHNTSKVLRLPRINDDGRVQSAACATKTATHLTKTSQKYCVCHTKRPSTRCQRHLNVTKCHACHAKRSKTTCETSKSDPSCTTYHRHGTAFTRTVADGCGRLGTVANGCGRLPVADGCGRLGNFERTHPQHPDPQSETGTFAMHSGIKNMRSSNPLQKNLWTIGHKKIVSHSYYTQLVVLNLYGFFSWTLATVSGFRALWKGRDAALHRFLILKSPGTLRKRNVVSNWCKVLNCNSCWCMGLSKSKGTSKIHKLITISGTHVLFLVKCMPAYPW